MSSVLRPRVSIKSNPGVNGNDLTSKWIYLVAWKVYQLWGVSLDKGHFVVFDSTQPGIKFSKHITVIIPSPKQSNSRDTANINKEMLFLNYSHVNVFVQNLLADITRHSEEEVVTHASVEASRSSKDTGDYSSSSSCAWKRSVAVPCSGFEDLWVKKEKGEGTCLFVDTGVYTRNRVFRMFGSSKHTPKNALTSLY